MRNHLRRKRLRQAAFARIMKCQPPQRTRQGVSPPAGSIYRKNITVSGAICILCLYKIQVKIKHNHIMRIAEIYTTFLPVSLRCEHMETRQKICVRSPTEATGIMLRLMAASRRRQTRRPSPQPRRNTAIGLNASAVIPLTPFGKNLFLHILRLWVCCLRKHCVSGASAQSRAIPHNIPDGCHMSFPVYTFCLAAKRCGFP